MRRLCLIVAAVLGPQVNAHAQARWTVDPKSSLAWWQMNPHMNHLWATTCPQEPSWRPGDERSAAFFMSNLLRAPTTADSVNVPLYPRYLARDVCTSDAVRGDVTARDTLTWRGVRGEIVVRADRLVSGQSQRDKYASEGVLESRQYPEIRFAIDSLTNVARQADTLTGSVTGVFALHGSSRPVVAAVRIWPEAGGLRVQAKFRMPVEDLVREYGLSSHALGLGVGLRVWLHLYMGVDLLLRPQPTVGRSQEGN